jgi:hypothetical protein
VNAPLRLFIGYDAREAIAYHVLCASLLRHASRPISITPIVRRQLKPSFARPRGPLESTDFSLSRFMVPYLVDYSGLAIFMDCDMLCRSDIYELLMYPVMYPQQSVFCCQHDYVPKAGTKFLGERQTVYPRKNWSSFLIFNADRCKALTPSYVNQATGSDLHRFAWLDDSDIGSLPLEWNYLVDEPGQSDESPKMVHFTNGGPWFNGYEHVSYAAEWRAERDAMQRVAAGHCNLAAAFHTEIG